MKPHENIMKCFFSLLIRLMEIRYKLYQIKKKRASERENHHHYESDAFIYEVCSLWKIIKKIIQTLIKAATWKMQQIFFLLFIIKTLIAACKKWWSPLGMDTLKWHNAVHFDLLFITSKVTFIMPFPSLVQILSFFLYSRKKILLFSTFFLVFRRNVCCCYGNVINQASM